MKYAEHIYNKLSKNFLEVAVADPLPGFPDQPSQSLNNPTPDDTLNWIIQKRQNAQALALSGLEDNPDDTARALELSRATGADPTLVDGNLDNAEKQLKATFTSEIIKKNAFLQDYINSHPLAAKISNDDWGNLDAVSQSLDKLLNSNGIGGILEKIPMPGGIPLGTSAAFTKGFLQKFGETHLGDLTSEISDRLGLLPIPRAEFALTGYPLELISHVLEAGAGGAEAAAEETYKRLGINQIYTHLPYAPPVGEEEGAKLFGRDIGGLVEAETTGMTGRSHVGEVAEEAVRRVQVRRFMDAAKIAKTFLDEGKDVPVGLHPVIDQFIANQSKENLKALDELYGAAQKSATRERSPEIFADFVRQHTNASIGIDAEAVRKLYGGEPGAPIEAAADDGKLGFVPNLQDQLALAEATHGDVDVPLADWVAKADPEVAKELHDFIRVRPGGMTLDEAKAPEIRAVPEQGEEPAVEPKEGATTPIEVTPVDALRTAAKLHPIPDFYARDSLAETSPIVPKEAEVAEKPLIYGPLKITPLAQFKLGDSLRQMPKDDTNVIGRALRKFMAAKLSEQVGDIPVHIISQSDMKAVSKAAKVPFNMAGFYNDTDKYIAISDNIASGRGFGGSKEAIETLVHEASHAFAQKVIETNADIAGDIKSMMREAEDALADTNHPLADRFKYYFTNEHEYLAGAHSDSAFQSFLEKTPVSDELRNQLHLSRTIHSQWDAFREIIKRIWKTLLGEEPQDNLLDAVLKVSDTIEKVRKDRAVRAERMGRATDILGSREREPELPKAGTTRMEDREIFKKAGAIGLTKAQYQRYQELIEAREAKDKEFRQQQAEALERKRQTQEWKDNEAKMKEEVTRDVGARPDIAADRLLREGDLYGEKVKRPKLNRNAIDPEMRKRIPSEYQADDGTHPDDVAGLFGYQSGNRMLEHLARLEEDRQAAGLTPKAHFAGLVAAETDRRMRKEYGNLEQNILDEAKEHVVDQTQLDLLHEETLSLAANANTEFSFTKEQVAKWVKDHFATLPLSAHSSDKYFAAAGKAGAKAENALLEDDPAEAFRAKQQQYLAVLSAKLAVKLEKERAQFTRLAARYSKREVAGTPAEYTNWVHDILIRTGNAVRRSVQDLQDAIGRETHGTLQEFVTAHNDNASIWEADENMPSDFQTMPVAPFLFDPSYRKPISEMTAEEFRAVHNSLKTIIKNGRDENKVMVSGEKADLAETIGKMADQLATLFSGKEKQYAFGHRDEGIGHTLRTYLASLMQIESIFNRFDRGDPRGIFKRTITEPIFEASNGLNTLERVFSRKYRDIGGFGKKSELQRKVDNPLFRDPLYDSELKQLTRENVLAILQNVGNTSQLDKLARGYGIKDQGAIMQWLFANTTKEDWDRAQALGDLFGEAFEESARMYHNLSGVAPEKIDLQPITTPFGEYKGWYHPLIYDPIRPGSSKKLMGPSPLEDGSYYRAATPSGYTKKRTGYAAPIQLNLDSIPWKLRQMLNDAAMRPAVTNAAKIFYDGKFQMAITKGYGKEIKDLLIPYLKDVAGQKVYKDAAQSTALRVLEKARQNVIATLIGLNPSTVAKHGPTAAMLSIKEVGAMPFLRELTGLLSMNDELGESNWNFAMHGGMVNGQRWNGSEELQRRARNWQETLTGTQADLFGENTLRNSVIKFGATPVALSDLLSAVPTWLASYKDRIRNGDSHGQAVEFADRAVRRAHGSSAVAARPRIMRGGPLAQFATPFYTFFNEMFQRQYEMAWQAKDALRGKSRSVEEQGLYEGGKQEVKNFMGGLWAYVLFPALVEQVVSPVLTGNEPTSVKVAGWGLRTIASSLPGIRDIAEAFVGGRDPTVGLYSTSAKMLVDMGKDLGKGRFAFDKRHAGITIKHFITGAGALTGLTNAQEGRTAEYVWNYATGVEHPHGLKDVMKGLWHGTSKELRR